MNISSSILYAPCPCGSGKKFKFCHFEEVRDALRNDPTQSDVTMAVRKAMQPFGMVNDVDPIEDRDAIQTMLAAMKDRDAGRAGKALAGFRKAREMTAFEDYPLSKADDKIFRRATRSFQTARPGTKTFEKAKNDLAELLERYPDYHRLQFNYASALERAGERDKAIRLVERIVEDHPDYAFARAALLDSAVQDGDFARAKAIHDAFQIPTRIHPQELRAWLRSALRYAEAAGLKQEARRIRRELEELLKAFPDM